MSEALKKRNEDVKYAKSLGIDAPHKLKGPALAEAIAEAEALKPEAAIIVDPDQEDDPFDDIDPEIEGDHLDPGIQPNLIDTDTREGWLLRAVDKLRPILKQHGATVPERIAVSVGYADRKASKTNGVCYNTSASDCKTTNHIFISPKLKEAWRVLLTLCHELIHASDNCASGHGGHFAQVARAMGYINKLTSSEANDELQRLLTEIADELGEYPHTGLNTSGDSSAGKKQTTRLVKFQCDSATCGMPIRVTRTWIDLYHDQIDEGWYCPCGQGTLREA